MFACKAKAKTDVTTRRNNLEPICMPPLLPPRALPLPERTSHQSLHVRPGFKLVPSAQVARGGRGAGAEHTGHMAKVKLLEVPAGPPCALLLRTTEADVNG
jgi:hypothetical protein